MFTYFATTRIYNIQCQILALVCTLIHILTIKKITGKLHGDKNINMSHYYFVF